MARTLKRICPECNSKATVGKTLRVQQGLDNLYCYCSNKDCSHIWVEIVEFSHTVKHSKLTGNRWENFIKSLLPEQKKQLKLALED
ncbi:ogr/Delta-like zinc finger family protein [Pasteurella skyensis]|uniref:Ogr/Delta-like zinc finger family protein n=1 Tax=Phocoenobacter skyensis TaxID=97481 RepID=A0AAJ6NBB2_9PAST|nr:ogr/Delta-like zinc finger family protein [Pasteurella skyensis]MDP8173668.1 ogr/Delta-like zinc finger family protein [Pasteurella skyensis]MDP8178036.1 ogr/Delta-like zinc finger family protein [Pasteurella skyensis]